MPEIHVTLLGRFAVTVGGIPVAVVWRDTAWEAALAEAQAAVAVAAGDPGTARTRLQRAAGQFQWAGRAP